MKSCLQFGFPGYLCWKKWKADQRGLAYGGDYKWYPGRRPALWHWALITDVSHVKGTERARAQCRTAAGLERTAEKASSRGGIEQLRAYFPFSPGCRM